MMCEMKCIGHCYLSSSQTKTALTTWSTTAKYKSNESPIAGRVRQGEFAKYCLIFSKASAHSTFHSKCADLRIALKKERHTSSE
jgi:hypothetical protein